jgi:hypothetical protein
MAWDRDVQIDQYSGFDHKEAMREDMHAFWLSSLVPPDDRRRHMAYVVARAIHENCSRRLLPIGGDAERFDQLREYGDAGAYAAAVSGGVLGTDILFSIKGANVELPEQPVLPHRPEPPTDPDEQGVLAAAHQAQIEVWAQTSFEAIEEWKRRKMEQPALISAQDWLREWAENGQIEAKLRELYKEDVQPAGDGILAIHAFPGQMPEVTLWDPESYFPKFPDGMITQFADNVSLGYEYQDDNGDAWFRRVKYELVDLEDEETGAPSSRPSPYSTVPTSTTCLMTDASYRLTGKESDVQSIHDLDDVVPDEVASFIDESGREVEMLNYDMGIDFIPLIHIPANPASKTHFGRSIYLRGAQLLDDLYQSDTSIMSAANLAGNPPIVVSGAIVQAGADGRVDLGPGTVVSTPEASGGLDKLDMTGELRALMEHRSELRKRAAQIFQVPEGVMGQASPEKIASGITLELTFTPFERLVVESRLAVDPKLALFLKFVMRLAVVAKSPGWEKVASVPPAMVKLGSFMPTDLPGLVEMVSVLRSAKVITRKVAATWLQSAGVGIEDIEQLLAELDAEDTERALDLEAMFGAAIAAKSLGIEIDEEAVERRAAEQADSGLGRFGTALDRGRARPQRPAVEGEDPAEARV